MIRHEDFREVNRVDCVDIILCKFMQSVSLIEKDTLVKRTILNMCKVVVNFSVKTQVLAIAGIVDL